MTGWVGEVMRLLAGARPSSPLGPQDECLRLHLTALDELDPDEPAGIRALIEGALLRHEARRLAQTS